MLLLLAALVAIAIAGEQNGQGWAAWNGLLEAEGVLFGWSLVYASATGC
jgi:hypothetical protein